MSNINKSVKQASKHVLREYQKPHFERIEEILKNYYGYLDTSEPGTGKTHIALALCLKYKMQLMVVCPKSMMGKWLDKADEYGVKMCDVLTYAGLRGTNKYPPKHGYLEIKNGKYIATKKFQKLAVNRLLLVFDESHNVKNKNAQFNASFALVKSVIGLCQNNRAPCRIALLSATPGNEKEHAGCVLKMLGFTTKDSLYEYNRSAKKYNLTGLQDIINKCHHMDPDKTYDITCRPVNRSTVNLICHDLLTCVVKPKCASEMTLPQNIYRKKDARDGYYNMPKEDVHKIMEGINLLSNTVQYHHDTKKIQLQKGCWGNITSALMLIESGKVQTMARLAREKLNRNSNCKVILYFNFLKNMQRAKNILHDFNPLYMDGQTQTKKRRDIIEKFQQDNNNYRVLISNPKVGGVGIDLDDITGNHQRYLYIVPTYNYIDLHQSAGRIYRQQTKSTATIRFVYSKDFPHETCILNAIARKRNIVRDMIIDNEQHVILPGEYKLEIEHDT